MAVATAKLSLRSGGRRRQRCDEQLIVNFACLQCSGDPLRCFKCVRRVRKCINGALQPFSSPLLTCAV
jgi:hypothetical protein